MTETDLVTAIATRLYNIVERGRGEFRSFSSISGELQSRYKILASEQIRFAEFNRHVRTQVKFDDESHAHVKDYMPLSMVPDGWMP